LNLHFLREKNSIISEFWGELHKILFLALYNLSTNAIIQFKKNKISNVLSSPRLPQIPTFSESCEKYLFLNTLSKKYYRL